MNPWDIKLVSNLSENELLRYARYLETTQVFKREQALNDAVEEVIDHWKSAQQQPSYGSRVEITLPFRSHGWVPEMGTVPVDTIASYRHIPVRLSAYLSEEAARYIAREILSEYVQT